MSMFIKEADVTTEAKRRYIEGEFIKINIAEVISALDSENKKSLKLIGQISDVISKLQ